MRGQFVDEIYTEDEDEAERLAMEEARRSSRMLGCVLLGSLFVLLVSGSWILLWPR